MKKIYTFTLATIVSTILVGCSTVETDPYAELSPETLYLQATMKLQKANVAEAIETLEALERLYPFGPLVTTTQLKLLQLYYETRETEKALALAERFIATHITDPNRDYVFYLKGVIHQETAEDTFKRMLNLSDVSQDKKEALRAINTFQTLLRLHPDSQYALDAKLRIISLRQQLAEHIFEILKFYHELDAPVAVINQGHQLMTKYQDTPAMRKALPLLREAYLTMGNLKMAKRLQQWIELNPLKLNEIEVQAPKSIKARPVQKSRVHRDQTANKQAM